jgi:hypothetical protein
MYVRPQAGARPLSLGERRTCNLTSQADPGGLVLYVGIAKREERWRDCDSMETIQSLGSLPPGNLGMKKGEILLNVLQVQLELPSLETGGEVQVHLIFPLVWTVLFLLLRTGGYLLLRSVQ